MSEEARDYISELIGMLRKPRLLCTCDDCRPSRQAPDEMMHYLMCANCRGWVSHERIINEQLTVYPVA